VSSKEHNLQIGDRVTTRSRLVPRLAGQTFEVDDVRSGDSVGDAIDLLANDETVFTLSHFTVDAAPSSLEGGAGASGHVESSSSGGQLAGDDVE